MAAKGLVKLFPNILSTTSKTLLTYTLKCQWKILSAGYAAPKKVGGKTVGPSKKKVLVVETNAEILCSRLCGGNIYKEGEDPVLGPDNDYPDWLWDLHIDKEPIPLEDISKEDLRYWKRLKKMTMRQQGKLRSVQKF